MLKDEFEEIMATRRRILDTAKGNIKRYLAAQDAFCSPMAFWSAALSNKLCTSKEYNKAHKYYGDMWNYAGD